MTRGKRQPQEGDVVIVRWYDTTGRSRWTPIKEAKQQKPLLIETVGFYLNEDKLATRLHMQTDREKEESVSDVTIIPKGTIKTIAVIKRGKR